MTAQLTAIDLTTARLRAAKLLDTFYERCDQGETVADLLEEQAQFVTPLRKAAGRDAIAAMLLSLAQDRQAQGGMSRHFGANVTAEDLGAGRFRIRSLMLVFIRESGGNAKGMMNMGDHDDIVAFDELGTCRFIRRTMTPVSRFALTPA